VGGREAEIGVDVIRPAARPGEVGARGEPPEAEEGGGDGEPGRISRRIAVTQEGDDRGVRGGMIRAGERGRRLPGHRGRGANRIAREPRRQRLDGQRIGQEPEPEGGSPGHGGVTVGQEVGEHRRGCGIADAAAGQRRPPPHLRVRIARRLPQRREVERPPVLRLHERGDHGDLRISQHHCR
jgi:hypothetical protein